MSYIENMAEELNSKQMINQASDLDDIACKLHSYCLQKLSCVYIIKESNEARLVDVMSAMVGVYKLIKLAGSSPVYLLSDHYDVEQASGFYFVIGKHQQIKARLLELQQDRANLNETHRWL